MPTYVLCFQGCSSALVQAPPCNSIVSLRLSIKSLKKRTHGLPRHGRIQGETKARQRTHGEGDCKGAVYHPRAVVRVGELARVIGCIQACMHHPPPCACSSTVEDRPSVVCGIISVWQNSWLECHVRAPVPLRTDETQDSTHTPLPPPYDRA